MGNFDPTIFKAYDIRGIYPSQINQEIAYQIGRGLVRYLKPVEVALGRDMRLSSDELFHGISQGIIDSGVAVIDLGLCSTDALYFAVGKFNYAAGVMITASHNPPEYNGFKICRQQAVPLSDKDGLNEIKAAIETQQYLVELRPNQSEQGRLISKEITADFVEHVLSFIDPQKIKPLRIAIDAGNGMAGALIPKVFARLPVQVIPLYFELDGSFPNHPASPIEPENLRDLQKAIKEKRCDLGAAFDGDADRMFLLDEQARPLGGDTITALVAQNLLQKHPGATILYNLICSRFVPEVIAHAGGKAVRTRVGHAFIKPLMKQYDAIFGGEHSGHFYFKKNWSADSGIIALLVCLELVSQANNPLSELAKRIDPYFRSGEINRPVADIPGKLKAIENYFAVAVTPAARLDHEDGLTVTYPDWWFNIRPSNTEPLLRLNVEADSVQLLKEKTDLLLMLLKN